MRVNEITVLVVDDEQIVREYFATQFPWDQVGMRWIGDAADGFSALEECRSLRPDLVLADISMPGMDGLQLLEHLGREVPYTNCALLTCHQDFDYVQTALRLGAIDYILKAATTPKEMVTKLQSVRKRIELRQNQARLTTLQRQWLAKLLLEGETDQRKIEADLQRLRLPLANQPVRVLLFQVDASLVQYEGDLNEDELRLSFQMETALESAVEGADSSAWTSLEPGTFALVANVRADEHGPESGVEMFSRALRGVQAGLGEEHPVFAGLSMVHARLMNGPSALAEARHAASCHFYSHNHELIVYQRAWRPVTQELRTALDHLVSAPFPPRVGLIRHIDNIISTTIHLCHEHWIDPKETRMLTTGILNRLTTNLGYTLSAWDKALWPLQAAEATTSGQLRDWAIQVISTLMVTSGDVDLRPEIRKVVDEIRADPSQPYDLGWAAERAGLHPNYFSTVFRNETGQRFTDYVCRLRMERAAVYIREGGWNMQQVAELVGVPNYRTFFNAFRRMMGASPSEFADRFRSGVEAQST